MTRKKTTPSRVVARTVAALPVGYASFLDGLKTRIRAAQVKAALAVNAELVLLYWRIGRDILVRQETEGWGARVIDRLSSDLRAAFPEMQGFSPRNLKYMRAFAATWADEAIVQGLLAQLTWYHNLTLLEKVARVEHRLWYARQAIEHGWSRNVLLAQIETSVHERAGKALTNFKATLPPPHSDLAQQTLKDPYVFDFLTLGPDAQERDLERGLLEHVRDFLLKLGVGFTFVGSQGAPRSRGRGLLRRPPLLPPPAPLLRRHRAQDRGVQARVRRQDELLPVRRRCPAPAPGDQPSIGLVLCKEKNKVIVEYALRDTKKPIGVSAYRMLEKLPAKLKGSFPTVEELEAELGGKMKPRDG